MWRHTLHNEEPNLIARACDPREGTRGSGIIRFREESDWSLIWNAQFGLSQDSWLPATDYPRASRSFPRIAGSGNEIVRNQTLFLFSYDRFIEKIPYVRFEFIVCNACIFVNNIYQGGSHCRYRLMRRVCQHSAKSRVFSSGCFGILPQVRWQGGEG
jgi:hypothetical protein